MGFIVYALDVAGFRCDDRDVLGYACESYATKNEAALAADWLQRSRGRFGFRYYVADDDQPMSILARMFRRIVYWRFGKNSSAADIITDYLEVPGPEDFRGAIRAWINLSHNCPFFGGYRV